MHHTNKMRNVLIALAPFFALIASALSSAPAAAADAGAVIRACDRTAGCSYWHDKVNGGISGCSPHACFTCPADGKHQCTGTSSRRGRHGKHAMATIGGIKLPPPSKGHRVKFGGFTRPSAGVKPPRHHRHPVTIGGFRAPSGVKRSGGGHSSGTILRMSNQHSGGGKHR